MIGLAVSFAEFQDIAYHGGQLAQIYNRMAEYNKEEKPHRTEMRQQIFVDTLASYVNRSGTEFVGNIDATAISIAIGNLALVPDEVTMTAMDAASILLSDLASKGANDPYGMSDGTVQSIANALGVVTSAYALSVQQLDANEVTQPSPPPPPLPPYLPGELEVSSGEFDAPSGRRVQEDAMTPVTPEEVAAASLDDKRALQRAVANRLVAALHDTASAATKRWVYDHERIYYPTPLTTRASAVVARVVIAECSAARDIDFDADVLAPPGQNASSAFHVHMGASAMCDANGRSDDEVAANALEAVNYARSVGSEQNVYALNVVNGSTDLVAFSLSANPFAALSPNVTNVMEV